jgi:hypothetical protein
MGSMFRQCVSVLSVLSLVLLCAGLASATAYTFTDISALTSNTGGGYGINASGMVTGYIGNNAQAFKFSGGTTVTALSVGPYNMGACGYAVGPNGAIAGCVDSHLSAGPAYWQACVWSPDGTIDLIPYMGDATPGTGVTGGKLAQAYGINTVDGVVEVVGHSQSYSTFVNYHAFKWTAAGGVVDLNVLAAGQPANALDVNSLGHIVGVATDSSVVSWAVFFDPTGVNPPTKLANLPTVSGVFNGSIAVNDSDWVVAGGKYVWKPNGTYIDLAARLTALGVGQSSINSRCDINNQGLVGLAPTIGGVSKAYIYDAVHDTVTSLNDLTVVGKPAGFVMNTALSIGNDGSITGYGTIGGQQHTYVLMVPEPSTLMLAVAGLFGSLVYAWRRR